MNDSGPVAESVTPVSWLAFSGLKNLAITDKVGLKQRQVGQWRRRWKESYEALVAIECNESAAALRRAIEDVLSDAPR